MLSSVWSHNGCAIHITMVATTRCLTTWSPPSLGPSNHMVQRNTAAQKHPFLGQAALDTNEKLLDHWWTFPSNQQLLAASNSCYYSGYSNAHNSEIDKLTKLRMISPNRTTSLDPCLFPRGRWDHQRRPRPNPASWWLWEWSSPVDPTWAPTPRGFDQLGRIG